MRWQLLGLGIGTSRGLNPQSFSCWAEFDLRRCAPSYHAIKYGGPLGLK